MVQALEILRGFRLGAGPVFCVKWWMAKLSLPALRLQESTRTYLRFEVASVGLSCFATSLFC
jgi:hypothetical protein